MIAALLLMLAAPADRALFDPQTGYRVAAYRGVIPAPPPGVSRIENAEAARLFDEGKTLFLDFTPAPGAVRDAQTGTWHLAVLHDTIPGARWFPEAGRGPPNPAIDRWLADGVRGLTYHRKRQPIVAFCLADCWMSWNASWKLARLGYRHVLWYANGIDGWRDMGRERIAASPEGADNSDRPAY